jgi:hypothetical protein
LVWSCSCSTNSDEYSGDKDGGDEDSGDEDSGNEGVEYPKKES